MKHNWNSKINEGVKHLLRYNGCDNYYIRK